MLDVIEMQLPGVVHSITIFANLNFRELRSFFLRTVQGNRKNICRAVREPNARAGERDLHDFTREIASLMRHVLIGGGNSAPGSVIVRTEMRRDAASMRGVCQRQKIYLTALIENGLRRFNHQLDSKTALRETKRRLKAGTNSRQRSGLLRNRDFRQRDKEVLWQRTSGFADKLG